MPIWALLDLICFKHAGETEAVSETLDWNNGTAVHQEGKRDPARPELTGFCLSAEPSRTEYRGNEREMRAEYVYQPVSNFVSEIKQPRICML